MYFTSILLSGIFLFAIIYFAVRLAIIPLINEEDEDITYKQDFGLVKLRDIDILSPSELDEVIKIYYSKGIQNSSNEEYHKYAKVLNELKSCGYFTDEEYLVRLNKLKVYFKIN